MTCVIFYYLNNPAKFEKRSDLLSLGTKRLRKPDTLISASVQAMRPEAAFFFWHSLEITQKEIRQCGETDGTAGTKAERIYRKEQSDKYVQKIRKTTV